MKRPPIAYFLSQYPAFNETFVIQELYALEKRGFPGVIAFEAFGQTDFIQPQVHLITYDKIHINSRPKLVSRLRELFGIHMSLLLRRPLGYLSAVAAFLSVCSVTSLRYFLRASLLVPELDGRGIRLAYIHDAQGITLIGLFAARMCGIRSCVIFHTHGLFANPAYLRQKIRLADTCIFQSAYSRDYAMRYAGIRGRKAGSMHVIPSPGVDTSLFSSGRKRRSSSRVRLVTVCRLEEMKGLDYLVHAVKILRSRGVDTRCTIVGYGSRRDDLQARIRREHLERYVRLAGALPHDRKLISVLSGSDFFVLPSVIDSNNDRDMAPNAVCEAMSVGLIVVTTRLGGIDEVIQDGVNGFLMNSVSARNIADTIERLNGFPRADILRIRAAARSTMTGRFEMRSVMDRLARVLSENANRPRYP